MRIAIAVEGTRGDVHPMLALGESFARAGCEVVICAPPDFRDTAGERGLAFRPVGRNVREFLEERSHLLHGSAWAALREGARFFRDNLALHFEALVDATAGADRVFGAGTEVAAASVAEARGISYRYIAYCPALFPSAEHPAFVVPNQDLPGWLNRWTWRAFAIGMNRMMRRAVNRHRGALGLPPLRDIFAHTFGAAPLLAAEPALAPAPADADLAIEPIGCLHPFAAEPLPAKLEAFLAAGETPVYIGFGSMTDPAPAQTTRTVLEAVARAGCRAVLSEGWAGLGAGPLPEGVCVVGSVSHAALFPRVAAVVHHGGAGTTTTAARAGAPQLVVPHVLDQFYWAKRVAQLGIGLPALRRNRLDAGALADALREITANEVLAERAAQVGERLRRDLALRTDAAQVLLRRSRRDHPTAYDP